MGIKKKKKNVANEEVLSDVSSINDNDDNASEVSNNTAAGEAL
jgi:hypothetical protein